MQARIEGDVLHGQRYFVNIELECTSLPKQGLERYTGLLSLLC